MIALGVIAAWEVAKRFGKVGPELIEKLALGTILSGVLGARAYHVIDYWDYYSQNWGKIFELWNGGLGIWGAIFGGLMYLVYFSRINKVKFYEISDSVVLGLPLAQAIGRIGNFINGELYGKNGEPLFAWEGGLNVLLFIFLFWINKKSKRLGVVTGSYLVGYGAIRIFLENFRSDEIIWRAGGIPVATWFGTVSIICGLMLLIKTRYGK